jgi:hypothetical protein
LALHRPYRVATRASLNVLHQVLPGALANDAIARQSLARLKTLDQAFGSSPKISVHGQTVASRAQEVLHRFGAFVDVTLFRGRPDAGDRTTRAELERARMLQSKFVGNTVIDRLQQHGFSSLEQLRGADASAVTQMISKMIGSTCWHNSSQARNAIQGVVNLANEFR